LGALFPDNGLLIGGDRNATHGSGARLYSLALGMAPGEDRRKLAEFARGALTHGVDPPALDYYSDEAYRGLERGYSFELARPYAERAAEICRLPTELGWWKAHNFVEMGTELVLARSWPELGSAASRLLADPEPLRGVIGLMSRELELGSPEFILESFPRMLPFLVLEEVTPERLAVAYERQVRHRHEVKEIDLAGAAELLEECAADVEATFEEFLGYVEPRVAELMEAYPPLEWERRNSSTVRRAGSAACAPKPVVARAEAATAKGNSSKRLPP